MNTKDYVEIFCPFCKDRIYKDCEIRIGYDGVPRCPYYELDRKILKEYCGKKYENYIEFVKDNLKDKLQKEEKKKCR